MTKAKIAGGAIATLGVLLAVAVCYRAFHRDGQPAAATSPASTPPIATAEETRSTEESTQGLLHGRITTVDGVTYEGRLRWGGSEEAFWGDSFNGSKDDNHWASLVPPERLPKERRPIAIFGIEIAQRERPIDLGRPFMAPFGTIARIEAQGREVRVTLKSGTVFDLDRFEASDLDDGVRVWDDRQGVVDLDSLRIRRIELLPTARLDVPLGRLHGTVRTNQGDFTGFLEWDRVGFFGTDELVGRTADGELRLRFDTVRTIARRSGDRALVTLRDGREIELSDPREFGQGHRGIYVDDRRYGRVLISWDICDRLDFGDPGAAGSGPAYDDFAAGGPLTGSVTTRAGLRLAGRLVFDLDESETVETLDASDRGVDYTLPFGRVASIVPPGSGAERARVALHSGEVLQLERTGDLGDGNAGLLIFVDGGERPDYVPWAEVERIDFDRPPTLIPRT
jgi:hypothetical protein